MVEKSWEIWKLFVARIFTKQKKLICRESYWFNMQKNGERLWRARVLTALGWDQGESLFLLSFVQFFVPLQFLLWSKAVLSLIFCHFCWLKFPSPPCPALSHVYSWTLLRQPERSLSVSCLETETWKFIELKATLLPVFEVGIVWTRTTLRDRIWKGKRKETTQRIPVLCHIC